jgi:LytS/YehU family sensor histidine kinase
MDPHFIFNCMASLQSLIWENKNDEADSYLSKFSRLLRMILDIFAEAIEVPTLIIQPFAENALWHGLMNKEDNRQLTIEVKAQDEMLVCIVEDNGIERQESMEQKAGLKKHVSKGMKIIEERLRIVREQTNNNGTGVEIIDLFTESQVPCGTKVFIRIPIKESA